MKAIVLLGLLLLAGAVAADSTRFIDATLLLDEAVMNEDEVPRNNTWPYHRMSFNGTTENSRIFMNLKNVRSTIGEGMEISAIVCSVYVTHINDEPTVAANTGSAGIYRMYKPYAPDSIWQSKWNGPGNQRWGTIRAENASDAGSDNNSDNSGYDRGATPYDTLVISASNRWEVFNVNPAWEDANGGFKWMIRHIIPSGDSVDFRLVCENSTGEDYVDRHPRAWVYYSEAEEPPAPSVQRWFGKWYGRLGQ